MSKETITSLIRIGEWLPDRPENNNPGANNILNVIVEGESYKPFKNFASATNAVSTSTRVFGAYSFVDDDGTVTNFASDQYELYLQSGSSWVNVSKASTATNTYGTASDAQWRFTAYGQRVIATNLADTIQSYLVGTSTAFAALSTSAPKAKDVAVINNFLVGVHIDDGAIRPNRVRWSALNDATNWSTANSATTLADFQDLEDDGGFNQRIIPTQNYGVIVRESQIVRMEFIGSPGIFEFTVAERGRGTKAMNSVISDGVYVYYLDDNGFYAFDGTRSIPIGDNKVDRYFLDKLDDTTLYLVKAAIDPIEKYIAWGYKDATKSGNITDIIMYHYNEQRWSQAVENLDILESFRSPGYTLEGLDAVSTNLDALGYSLDSRVWQGGKLSLAGFSTDHKLGFFEGTNKAATLESAEANINTGGRAFISSVLPVTDSTGVYARMRHRANQYGSITDSSSATFNTRNGEIPFRINDRYHRVEFTIAAGSTWELFQGFHFRHRPTGVR